MKILIVEDELIIALMVEQMIRNLGHEVINTVSSGEEAIEEALNSNPDLILMDIRLKGRIDGIEAMNEIRKKNDIPVVFITGNTDQMYQQRISNLEYLEFLTKPITIKELSRSVDRAS